MDIAGPWAAPKYCHGVRITPELADLLLHPPKGSHHVLEGSVTLSTPRVCVEITLREQERSVAMRKNMYFCTTPGTLNSKLGFHKHPSVFYWKVSLHNIAGDPVWEVYGSVYYSMPYVFFIPGSSRWDQGISLNTSKWTASPERGPTPWKCFKFDLSELNFRPILSELFT